MPTPVHFEINADNPERAIKFYTDVFGWEIRKWDGPMDYWLVTTRPEGTPGINGGLMKRSSPNVTTVNTIGVPDLDATPAQIVQSGGQIAMARTTLPKIGYFAYCTDTEGNLFGVMQSDPTAGA